MLAALDRLSYGDSQLAIKKVGTSLQEKHTKWRTKQASPMAVLEKCLEKKKSLTAFLKMLGERSKK